MHPCFWCKALTDQLGIALASEYYGRESEVVTFKSVPGSLDRDAYVADCGDCYGESQKVA